MSDTPPPIPLPAVPGGKNKYQEIVRASWLAPLIAFAVNFVLVAGQGGKIGPPNKVQMIVGPAFIIGGLLFGVASLFGIRRHGTRKILVPALVGIGINLFLIVMAALPSFYLTRKQARLQPAIHSPTSRLLQDDRLRFGMDIPDGFKDFPEGKKAPTVEHVFIKEIPQSSEGRFVILVEKLNGVLSKNQPMSMEDIQKRTPPGVSAKLVEKNWRGLKVQAIVAELSQNGIRLVVHTLQIPLVPSAIQISVTAPESRRAEAEQLAETLLASLEGNTNW